MIFKRGIMAIKRWIYTPADREAAKDIAETCGCGLFCALLLAGRGMTDYSEIDEFLSTDVFFSDPLSISGMSAAAERLRQAIENGEKIAVFGDYDADGVTATALLFDCLQRLGATVVRRVPLRENGYGIRVDDVCMLHENEVSIIVTVDNGIAAFEAADAARKLGITMIITDHHLPADTLPDTDIIIDPHIEGSEAEYRDYAGVGVAFMLACAVCECDPVELIPRYGDIVAIGTVADVVPLTGDNRAFVRYGCEMISGFASCGVKHLADLSGLENRQVDSRAIAFALAPRINAAGRMADATDAVNLLLGDDDAVCEELAARLCEYNVRRKDVESVITAAAEEMIKADPSLIEMPVLMIKGENFHAGVLGIAAAKLCSKYGRPCIVFTEQAGEIHGSARSYKGVSIFEILKGANEHLLRFGGHELAAGVSILESEYDDAVAAINESALNLYPEMPLPPLDVSLKLNPAALDVSAVYATQPLEPFGAGNDAPVYLLERMTVERIDEAGKTGGHTRLTLSRDGARVTAMYFFKKKSEIFFEKGDLIDAAVTLEINHFNDLERLTVIIKDLHFSGVSYEMMGLDLRSFELWKIAGRKNALCEEIHISREDVAAVWKNLKSRGKIIGTEDIIERRIGRQRLLKTWIILDVLSELQMVKLRKDEFVEIEFVKDPKKNPLENSPTFRAFCKEGEISGLQ